MSTLNWVLLLFLGSSILFFGAVIIYYKFFRRYTREKFAFQVFLLIGSLSGSVIFILLSPKASLGLLISAIASIFGASVDDVEPSLSDKVLAIVVLLSLIFLAIKLHKNWPGAISTREHEAIVAGAKPNLVVGVIAAIADITGQARLLPFEAGRTGKEVSAIDLATTDARAWHIWVARILQLGSHQLHIDELKDWYPERQVFISFYGSKKTIVGIACRSTKPADQEIRDLKEFIVAQRGLPLRIIVAIDDDSIVRSACELDGVEIEYRHRKELFDSLVDFSAYRADIRFRYESAEIAEGYPFKIPDVYVPSAGFVRREGLNEPIDDVESYLAEWLSEQSLRHIALLGEYGQGKSLLALRLTYRVLFEVNTVRTPILITLGGRSPRTESKLNILASWAAAYDINPKALLALHEAGHLLLLFDGFDEMDLVGDARLRLEHFRSLWQFSADRKSKILITGRPNFFLDQAETERSLNIRNGSMEVPFTEPVYLSPFDMPKIERALRSFDSDVRSEIVKLISLQSGGGSFRDLLSRPSTLFLTASIWKQLRSENPNNITSAEVIGRFIAHAYERQERKEIQPFLNVAEREYFMIGMALAMHSITSWSNSISKDGFQESIFRLTECFADEITQYGAVVSRPLPPLRERLQDRQMLMETVSTDVRSCGIIVTDLSQIDSFKFAHKSFFEYLLAANIVYSTLESASNREKTVHRAARRFDGAVSLVGSVLIGASNRTDITREVARFAGEILYKLSGVTEQMSESAVERRLAALGIRIRYVRRVALFRAMRFDGIWASAVAAYPSLIFTLLSKCPTAFLLVLAEFYAIHGKGGKEFSRYKEKREKSLASKTIVRG
jgi:hypothetical protein